MLNKLTKELIFYLNNIKCFENKSMKQYFKEKSASTFESNLDDLSWDPTQREIILGYHPNQIKGTEIRRKYFTRVPCQPYYHV